MCDALPHGRTAHEQSIRRENALAQLGRISEAIVIQCDISTGTVMFCRM